MYKLVSKFFRVPWVDKCIFMEALFWIIVARVTIKYFPIRYYARFLLGKHMAVSPYLDVGRHKDLLQRISTALQIIGLHVPLGNNCLANAIAARLMLKHRRVKTTLYLGVQKHEQQGLSAHSWLRCGTIFVIGGDGEEFTVVSTFADC